MRKYIAGFLAIMGLVWTCLGAITWLASSGLSPEQTLSVTGLAFLAVAGVVYFWGRK